VVLGFALCTTCRPMVACCILLIVWVRGREKAPPVVETLLRFHYKRGFVTVL